MDEPLILEVQALGKRYAELKKQMVDFRLFTQPRFGQDLLDEIHSVRSRMVDLGAAIPLEDGSIIVKTEFIIAFLQPDLPELSFARRNAPDLSNPEVVEKIALSCGLNQWMFLASRLPTEEQREDFLRQCAKIVSDKTRGQL
ncbi:hypothetical protein [Limnobacter sp.]|uniref:hypothetical protein n=1 Tax=Limnobacter sp. TaxID=2003368 RepID=UPI00351483B3